MNFIKPLQSKEIKENGQKAKFIFFGFVLILALVYFMMGAVKVSAVTTAEITGTSYNKNGSTIEDFDKKDLVNGSDTLTFIQGNGEDSKVAINFTINDFPSNATSFMIVESERSDSMGENADADRYSKGDDFEWHPSSSNKTLNGLTGSATFSTDADGKISADIVYRIRNGGFGLKFLKVFFYVGVISESNLSTSIEVFYVISKPIDTVEQGETCTTKGDTICTDYVDGDPTRASRELKLYVPETIAYIFKALNDENLTSEEVIRDYANTELSTVYAINYFNEASNGTVSVVTNINAANRSYLYTDFFIEGMDTQATVDELIEDGNAQYLNYLNSYKANKISYLTMEVDATGSYFFYITDIFGNVKEIKQDVTDVKNRSIETIVKKGNATVNGYGAEETFTNESVSVTLTMTVKTNFEWGICLNGKCVEIIDLTKNNVSIIRYWRVDVKIENGVDRDAYIPGDPVTKNYASETYAASGSKYNLYCRTSSDCTGAQTYDLDKKYDEDGAGFASFEDNVLTMYIGTSGRYRFYIQDMYGNNTWGDESDRNIEEYRNPRVEVYAIDKAGPEITFEHDDIIGVEGTDLTMFDIETYAYYMGIDLEKDAEGKFVYDGRVVGTDAVSKTITSYIYYKSDVNEKGTNDTDFTNDMAISMSHVRVGEYVYYYTNTKDMYSDYSMYDRLGENGPYYKLKAYDADVYADEVYDNTRINTISKNTKHNSNGLKLTEGLFGFKEINYYHNDGEKRVCAQIGALDGLEEYAGKTNELDCVNYYLDHGVDFIIEFVAEDSVGNVTTNRVYVNVVDTTPPGFSAYDNEDNAVKGSNIGTKCRMEIGQEIGQGKTQDKTAILKCYNVILNNNYSFEDNRYDLDVDDGLSSSNRINSNTYVKLYMLADDGTTWIDLEAGTFIPNKTGYYDMKIEIHDDTPAATGTNVLTVLVSYYVDKKIVLVEPVKNEKFYGQDDPTFDYCVYIDEGNHSDIRFSDNPYSDLTIYTKIYCSSDSEETKNAGKVKLFQENTDAGFTGALSRLESVWYNANLDSPIYFDAAHEIGVENNYVGLYRLMLGTLNINVLDENGDDTGAQDEDYIVKVHPTFRDDTKYNGEQNGNKIIDATTPKVTTGLDNNPLEDDNPYTQSNVDFTIKQIVVKVNASGGNKNYGDRDTNSSYYNSDGASTSNKYLNGFTVSGLINSGQYSDTIDIILGVLRREVGENVGRYAICNYRGLELADNALETVNNMYLDCLDEQTAGVTFNTDVTNYTGYTYANGIMVVNENYIKSRALYVATNKSIDGRTLNTTTNSRNNTYTNYVIEFTGNDYIINSIDLVVQAAPGQRREYNFTDTYDPDPWEIILYGLVDGSIKKATDDTFNGFTLDIIEGDYYGADANANECDDADTNAKCYVAKLAANQSENRTNWYLWHEEAKLTGYKTNETYKLLRNAANGSGAGSAKLVRESGKNGGWYLYKTLANDLNIEGIASDTTGVSSIAVITNDMNNCSYDETGHEVTVNGSLPCKNYNLVYNPYYTDADGYTIENKKEGAQDSDYVYKSFGSSCVVLDPDLPCENTVAEPQKIYKILFEIYRREIILEFNSAIETVLLGASETFDIVYGKRYSFYNTNYFDIGYYTGKTFVYPEDYLFLCYQNATDRATFDPENPSSTGCTGDPKYGLTAGDTWENIGIKFEMHTLVSSPTSDYYDSDDLAVPGGVYYIYSDIKEEQKANYNYKYKGGAMTIKSLSVEIVVTSYLKEYGEAYYSKYGNGASYSGYTSFDRACMNDGLIANSNEALINLGENIYCTDVDTDFGNTNKNVYGFTVTGLDSQDAIADNFKGRPKRTTNGSVPAADVNRLQDNVGIYVVDQGTIQTKNNNEFMTGNACSSQNLKGSYGDCVVVTGKAINNYVVTGESREYVFDMKGIADVTSDKPLVTNPTLVKGTMYIIPATLTITVASNQTKMYGCAYNAFNTNANVSSYTYDGGYANCVEGTGNYYDLGYKYTVSGDKDYQIAQNGYNYISNSTYDVSGIKGDDSFRPKVKTAGIKAHALNDFGTLYRIEDTETNRTSIKADTYVSAAGSAQAVTGNTYQKQTVGNYILTLGNVNASVNADNLSVYTNKCDVNNMPDADGAYSCKNYHVSYYGTKVYNVSESEPDTAQTYVNGENEFPTELLFTITKRTIYTYTSYDQKIYGDPDQDVSYLCGDYNMDGVVDENDNVGEINGDIYHGFCTSEQVAANKDSDEENNVTVNYGLTRYYTKYNSLAKAPWNGLGTRDDVQTDVISGKISRRGMGSNDPQTDDIKGFYEYRYADFTGTVALKSYGSSNYTVNYYEENESGDMVAVNSDGGFTVTVVEDGESKTYPVKFEIVLRQIKVAFVSFNKVYGEQDDVRNYNILVCAPTETFDFVNMKCTGKDINDKHGLSAAHTSRYLEDGILKQQSFKDDFVVRFIRVLGENVSCGTSSRIQRTLYGYFFGSDINEEGTEYYVDLSCDTTSVSGKSVYETLAYVDQNSNSNPGFNYQISYQTGYVNITPRPILITPDSGQGFTYGDYHDTLIPAIGFTNSVISGDGIVQSYGLVNGGASSEGVCLRNIDYYNNSTAGTKDGGTCFNINDRQDEYDSATSMTLSAYNASLVNSDSGLANVTIKNYVFGDVYTSESSSRSALWRTYSEANVSDEKYNRNVGSYLIVLGDPEAGGLKDKTGNYSISLSSTKVYYTISVAKITVTPESTTYTGTSQNNQYKIYGEQDKELTFQVTTTYTVKYTHYAKYNVKINKVCDSDNVCKTRSELTRYNYVSESKSFTTATDGEYIQLLTGATVELSDFAYDENMNNSNLNYGVNKSKTKVTGSLGEVIGQGSVTGSMYYDIACKDQPEDIGCNTDDKTLSYGETSRILLGYLYVDNYAQKVGTYVIKNGFKVANNEHGVKNYELNSLADVNFTIIPRPVGVQIQNVEKTYGQSTDKISCEMIEGSMIPCEPISGILHSDAEGYLRYNFIVEYFGESTRVENILGNNTNLYIQNGKFANGLVPETQKNYSEYSRAESKNSDDLGVYVSRDERNVSNGNCLYNGDTYGFCEDAGKYYLRFYGYAYKTDHFAEEKDNYSNVYKLKTSKYTDLVSSVSSYYYESYFGYNPNYFVIVVESDTVADTETDEVAVEKDDLFEDTTPSTSRTNENNQKLLKATGTLTIKKKEIKVYVNTSYTGGGPEKYYIEQNTNPPSLPEINNTFDLQFENFDKDGQRETSVGSGDTYSTVVWGRHPAQVRTGDKLAGELAYCDTIISENDYMALKNAGILSDYSCTNRIYQDNKNSLNTNLEGYIPIIRDTTRLSIVSAAVTNNTANSTYESTNYTTTFYPGGLKIAKDDTPPVVEVNRSDVYIEANGVGEYLFECVGANGTTTYSDCNGIQIVGKTELVEGTPILDWLNTPGVMQTGDTAEITNIIRVNLPMILGCEDNEYECTASAYYQLMSGKGKDGFNSVGITAGQESSLVSPFVMEKKDNDGKLVYLKNAGPTNLKELVITLVSWFGVTAYDQGEIKGTEILDKDFDKYWYLVIEKQGTNGDFNIGRIGEYKVHFYVMDNAGNVSKGNMYENGELQDVYTNVGTLHIVDTTKPVVGTLNLYNGKVTCPTSDDTTPVDCTLESNWVVAQDTYLPINILGRYDSEGNPSSNGEYIIVDKLTNMTTLSSVQKYSRIDSQSGATYTPDNTFGKYIKIASGASALALKHYGWSNSSTGIWLTITGGSDNSFTETSFPARQVGNTLLKDDSQWQHYYSRDGGITWFLYDRISKDSVLALDSEGTREILIKAVDRGVKIKDGGATEIEVTYTEKYYGDNNSNNVTRKITSYRFEDTTEYDEWLATFETWSDTLKAENESVRQEKLNHVGWNVSDYAANDKTMAEKISQLIYGYKAEKEAGDDETVKVSNYKYLRDRQTAYLDTVSPVISFGEANGEKLYVYEYGCSFCTTGYTEHYAGARDSYPTSNTSREIPSSAYDKNNSIVINHTIFDKNIENSGYQGDYTNISQEDIKVKNGVGGLGSDRYVMNGTNVGQDIRNVYSEERRYIIYAFDEDDNRTVSDLSSLIPTTIDTEDENYDESNIYRVIMPSIPENYDGDMTYTIVYSVIDKAGNESIYIARGVIFASLVPSIEVDSVSNEVEQIDDDTYYLNVEQGTDVEQVVNDLLVSGGERTNYITQTVYYNGELVVDNKRYNPDIYDGFTTNTPGVYEITYNLQYMHYGENGQSEMLKAKPIKLVINVEATPPITEKIFKVNYSSLILLFSVLMGGIFIALVAASNRKRI